ncbi:MAG: cystathionine beta-lyase [Alphaproteobacteria bacterium]|nr:cystathionine beta-lyase [Alphaproteobacteria bacterium]
MADDKPDTIVVSAGRMSQEHFGTVNTPVYRTSTILHPNLASLKAEKSKRYVYGRRGTPTTTSFEDAISALEGAARTVSLPSGLNAITTAILSVCGAGDHILVTDNCYWPTRQFCGSVLKRFGVETTFYDPLIGEGIAALFRPNTRAVFCESPGSLTFEIQDVPAIAAEAHARGASVLMDNTWGTPIFFPALKRGVDLSIQAGTKYIGGHSDVMVGYVAANESHADRLRDFSGTMGQFLGGDDCFLALRGVRTLAVRLERHQKTALKLARWLETQPQVSRVLYPALESDPGHRLWKRDFLGACGLFGAVLKPVSDGKLAAMMDGLRHFGIGYSWGGYESLIIPAEFVRTARKFEAEGPVIRIHAGLDDPDDLLVDLEAGLKRLG